MKPFFICIYKNNISFKNWFSVIFGHIPKLDRSWKENWSANANTDFRLSLVMLPFIFLMSINFGFMQVPDLIHATLGNSLPKWIICRSTSLARQLTINLSKTNDLQPIPRKWIWYQLLLEYFSNNPHFSLILICFAS